MSFFGFLVKKKFYIHLGISVIVSFILLIIAFRLLSVYTHHGDTFIVPNFSGLTMEQIHEQDMDASFDFIITDSIYDENLHPGTVALQNPSAGSKVKEGRNIYITTVALTPEVTQMPNLEDLTARQAVSSLRACGLKIRILKYIPNRAENAVLGQYFNGDTIHAGDEILKGSKVDLMIGLGDNSPGQVPFVIGLTVEEAHDIINMASFNVGEEFFFDDQDLRHNRVYSQSPSWASENKLYPGSLINLWYRSDINVNFDSLVRMVRPDTTVIDSLNLDFPEDSISGDE
jgi:beta-lactam-binding protein with PASTA domain